MGAKSTTTATHLPTTRALDQPGFNLAHDKRSFKLAEFFHRPLNMSFNNFFFHGSTGKSDWIQVLVKCEMEFQTRKMSCVFICMHHNYYFKANVCAMRWRPEVLDLNVSKMPNKCLDLCPLCSKKRIELRYAYHLWLFAHIAVYSPKPYHAVVSRLMNCSSVSWVLWYIRPYRQTWRLIKKQWFKCGVRLTRITVTKRRVSVAAATVLPRWCRI